MDKFACRTCLYVDGNISSFKLVEKVKNILEMCVPEIKPNLSKNTIICTQCYYFLKNIENFKLKCIENQNTLLNYNSLAHTSTPFPHPQQKVQLVQIHPSSQQNLDTERVAAREVNVNSLQEFNLSPQTSITIIPAKETPPNNIPKQQISIKEQKSKSYKKTKFSNQPSAEFEDVIDISDGELELNDKTKLYYSESSYEEDDIFEEKPTSITIVKNEPEPEINPSFFNKKSEEGYYHCKLCARKYKHSEGLYNHTLSEHKDLKFYHCNMCNFFSLWKSALSRHESLFHGDEDAPSSNETEMLFLFCYHCTFKTKSKFDLEEHIRFHFNDRTTTYTCTTCKRNFLKKSLYDIHLKSHEKRQMSHANTLRHI
ncbi:hypothetical protein JTB14_005695 [Gonioctena quinquepunctata]|nr:hypothetical protein JTB14_005695 [Gonioctena quinquepunctata]